MVDPNFPCRVPVELRRHRDGGEDVYGNPRAGYGPAEQILVFSVVVSGSEDPTQQRPEAAEHRITVYAPSELGVGDRDRLIYRGESYEVDGLPGCWDDNPWWSPGLSEVRCKEVKG